MAIKALCVDDEGKHHMIIGLSREKIASVLRGDVFTLPPGLVPFNEKSDVVLVFAETDEELKKRLPPVLKPL